MKKFICIALCLLLAQIIPTTYAQDYFSTAYMEYSPDGTKIASISLLTSDRVQKLIIWDAITGEKVSTIYLTGPSSQYIELGYTSNFSWSPESTKIAIASRSDKSGLLLILDTQTLQLSDYPFGSSVDSVKWYSEDRILVAYQGEFGQIATTIESSLMLWDLVSALPVWVVKLPELNGVSNIGISNSIVFAGGYQEFKYNLWSIENGSLVFSFNTEQLAGSDVSFSSSTRKVLISNYENGTLSIIQAETGQVIDSKPLTSGIYRLSWNSNGTKYALIDSNGIFSVISTDNNSRSSFSSDIGNFAWHPNQDVIALSCFTSLERLDIYNATTSILLNPANQLIPSANPTATGKRAP